LGALESCDSRFKRFGNCQDYDAENQSPHCAVGDNL
jgi:hypothetical protein